ncbi:MULTISPECIES: hypothetical protein [Chryseobacterium]|uniref:Uncharacterized protein n=1 Tax=Chryseobacterium geocarposphaerae TaxID=1416776 RepID=A0ABU1L928_9FLAO|nr:MULTISPECIES: hypothetical protein [Chryseobacterium]MDR6403226.1 hypothetical protein [Chryseobacterium geocarposphaerae]MDR6696780.1 hypothetical protein [Chryseobacterium ginsenosidimutans]
MLYYKKLIESVEERQKLATKAYQYGTEVLELPSDELIIENLRQTIDDWVASKPFQVTRTISLGSIKPSLGLEDDQPKAYWKKFPDKYSLYKQLIYDSHPVLKRNQQEEVRLATEVLHNYTITAILNQLRRDIAVKLWSNESFAGKLSYYVTTNPLASLLPNMSGSYNLANSYPKRRIYEKRDRISLAFSEDNFSVSENIAILHDVKELFSPINNSRALPTAHPELIPHPYQGKNSPPKPTRWETDIEALHIRVDVARLGMKSSTEIKWDQGRLGAGTRNEESPDTLTARRTKMPIETGRSHTAARLFEMVSLLKPGENASIEEEELFENRIRAVAYAIFAYWNAPTQYGGYPKSLTPIHTYHEVMDPAEDYAPGIYAHPFSYRDLIDYLQKNN